MITSAYDVLGISSNASSDQIYKAYRDLAKLYHPDVIGNRGDRKALSMWLLVKEAYDLISNEKHRKIYDELRKVSDGNMESSEGNSSYHGQITVNITREWAVRISWWDD